MPPVSWLGHCATLALTLSTCLGVPLSPALSLVLPAQCRHHLGEGVIAHSAGMVTMVGTQERYNCCIAASADLASSSTGRGTENQGSGSRWQESVPGHAGARRAVKAELSLPPGMEVPGLMELDWDGRAIRDGCALIWNPSSPLQRGNAAL